MQGMLRLHIIFPTRLYKRLPGKFRMTGIGITFATKFSKEARNANLKIDMLFIDADHSKESVLDDFKAYFDLVTVDGIILLHDSYPANEQDALPGYCGDCYKAIEELSKNTEAYEMMTIPVPPGLTLCRKRKKQVAWISS